ncbi:glycosyltransferase 61 family protein [Egbenema bharatensis]|uniref:glycosyltransferase 61 family protein n=1 Tax=Egbenema bharatensis TaxID=3463334 RepID=UPI003A86AF7E
MGVVFNHYFVKQKIQQVLTGRQSYQQVSDRSWILHPETRRTHPPAIYLEGDLDKIKGLAPFGSYEIIFSQIQGGSQVHDATIAYCLRNARLIQGHLYKGGYHHSLAEAPHKLWVNEPEQHFLQASLACTWVGNKWFGDWMLCDVPLTLVAQTVAPPVRTVRPPYRDEPGYRQLFQLHSTPVSHAHFDEIFIIDDRGQNDYMRERHASLRSLLRSAYPLSPHSKVMLKRGSDGETRPIKNAAAVEAFLMRQGFAIVEPAKLAPEEIVQQVLGAQLVLGVEGSQLTHALYTIADGGTLLTLQPPRRFNSVLKIFTDCMDLNFALFLGDIADNGFTIDIERLAKLLDKIESVTGR